MHMLRSFIAHNPRSSHLQSWFFDWNILNYYKVMDCLIWLLVLSCYYRWKHIRWFFDRCEPAFDDSNLELGRQTILLFAFIIANDITNYVLQGFEPHAQDRSKLCKTVYVRRIVVSLTVDQMLHELLSKLVAIFTKRIVVYSVPERSELVNNLNYLLRTVISKPDREWLF